MPLIIQSLLWVFVVASMHACAAPSPPITQPSASSPHLVGIWFRGFNIRADDIEHEVFGLIVESRAPVCSDRSEVAEALLAGATICATFRSAREAWKLADDLRQTGPGISDWLCVHFDAPLWVEHRQPPTQDTARYPLRLDEPIGDADAGLSWPILYVLPPPLQQRGIAIAANRPKANSLWARYPNDCSTSILTSWQDIEARINPRALRSWAGTCDCLLYWANGELRSLPWQDRAALQRP
jgi:hypothetical protein